MLIGRKRSHDPRSGRLIGGWKKSHDPQSGHLIGGGEPEGTSGRTEVTWFWGGKPRTGRGSTGSDVMMNRKCMEMGRSCDFAWETADRWRKKGSWAQFKTRDAMLKKVHFLNPDFMLQAGTWAPGPNWSVARPRCSKFKVQTRERREVWVRVKKKRHTNVLILLLGGLVTVRIGLKRGGIDDSLVVHQLVTLLVRMSTQFVLFGVSEDLVGIDDLGLAQFLLRVLDFVEDVLSHDLIIQLGFAFGVESEPPHFAFDFALFGFVPIILRTARHEFFNVIVGVLFTCKVAEVIAQDRAGLPHLF